MIKLFSSYLTNHEIYSVQAVQVSSDYKAKFESRYGYSLVRVSSGASRQKKHFGFKTVPIFLITRTILKKEFLVQQNGDTIKKKVITQRRIADSVKWIQKQNWPGQKTSSCLFMHQLTLIIPNMICIIFENIKSYNDRPENIFKAKASLS